MISVWISMRTVCSQEGSLHKYVRNNFIVIYTTQWRTEKYRNMENIIINKWPGTNSKNWITNRLFISIEICASVEGTGFDMPQSCYAFEFVCCWLCRDSELRYVELRTYENKRNTKQFMFADCCVLWELYTTHTVLDWKLCGIAFLIFMHVHIVSIAGR